ncbi:hypothetical protein JZU69_06320 [bacterium]|jgi:hypothetical protein|nr:hypothetical protein [bacterium]
MALYLTKAASRRERMAGLLSSDRAFFYIDGIPTKGLWINLDDANSWADIHATLQTAGLTSEDSAGVLFFMIDAMLIIRLKFGHDAQ